MNDWTELTGWLLANLPTWGIAGVAAYLGGYLSVKGKNLATVEDLPSIEKITQAIRHEFDLKRDLAAHERTKEGLVAEERLAAYQEAFRLWRTLAFQLFSEEIVKTVGELEQFYDTKGLYLSQRARDALLDAKNHSVHYKDYVASKDISREKVQETYKRIWELGTILEEETGLPALGKGSSEST
jgi:hypothetical protein